MSTHDTTCDRLNRCSQSLKHDVITYSCISSLLYHVYYYTSVAYILLCYCGIYIIILLYHVYILLYYCSIYITIQVWQIHYYIIAAYNILLYSTIVAYE